MLRYSKVDKGEIRDVKAKNLIASFEKGQVVGGQGAGDETSATASKCRSPENIPEEQAKPGTARKLLAAFQQLEQAPTKQQQPPLKASVKKAHGKPKTQSSEGVKAQDPPSTATAEQPPESRTPAGPDHRVGAAVQPLAADPPQTAPTKTRVLLVHDGLTRSRTLREGTVRGLEDQGCVVEVCDLRAQGFRPLQTLLHTSGDASQDGCEYEDFEAVLEGGTVTKDILEHQTKVQAADLIILHYQNLVNKTSALMLGWLQSVLLPGFAFDRHSGKVFDKGMLKGKRVLVMVNTAGSRAAWTEKGIMGDVNVSLWPLLNGVLRFCGFDVLAPHVTYSSHPSTPEDQNAFLSRLESIWKETPMRFVANDKFEEVGTLKESALAGLL